MLSTLIIAVLLSSQPVEPSNGASALQPASHAPPSDLLKTKASAEDETPVCREIVYTGTRFGSKECHTQREWKQMASDAGDYQSYIDRHANSFCLSGKDGCH